MNPYKGDSKGKIPIGTQFTDLLGDWKCPAGKKTFKPLAGSGSATETVGQFFKFLMVKSIERYF